MKNIKYVTEPTAKAIGKIDDFNTCNPKNAQNSKSFW